jgi:hypothetical protein
MFAQKKIVKEKGAEPEPFEVDVAQVRCSPVVLHHLQHSRAVAARMRAARGHV